MLLLLCRRRPVGNRLRCCPHGASGQKSPGRDAAPGNPLAEPPERCRPSGSPSRLGRATPPICICRCQASPATPQMKSSAQSMQSDACPLASASGANRSMTVSVYLVVEPILIHWHRGYATVSIALRGRIGTLGSSISRHRSEPVRESVDLGRPGRAQMGGSAGGRYLRRGAVRRSGRASPSPLARGCRSRRSFPPSRRSPPACAQSVASPSALTGGLAVEIALSEGCVMG